MIWVLALLSCKHEIPPHLQVDRPQASQEQSEQPQGLADLVRSDPLARRPNPRQPGSWLSLQDGAALEAWAAIARRSAATPSDWAQLEQSHPATPVVALSRGARLAALEVSMADSMDEAAQQKAAAWLGTIRVDVRPTTSKPKQPMDWIPGITAEEKRQGALRIAERMVLLGWLESPEIDILPAATALTDSAHTRLRDTPAGNLVVTRASDERSPSAGEVGRSALLEGTRLALASVAADRDTEQDELKLVLQAAKNTLGTEEDPIATWLKRARIGLSADASNDESASLALIALTAERLLGTCPDVPCEGLDRTQTLQQAASWTPQSMPLARVWQVIAVKQAADTLESSYKKPSFGQTLLEIADPLSGTGGGPVELSLLRYRVAEPTALLQISRLAQGPASTDALEVITSVRAHLVRTCDAALKERLPADIARQIRKIRDRARRRPR